MSSKVSIASPGMNSIKAEVDEFKRRRILEEAIEQFFEKGYEATSLESIADGIGVTKQFIYSRPWRYGERKPGCSDNVTQQRSAFQLPGVPSRRRCADHLHHRHELGWLGSGVPATTRSTSERGHAEGLIQLIARGFAARDELLAMDDEAARNLSDMRKRHLERMARLAYLAPDIISAILNGRQPRNITTRSMARINSLPNSWAAQRAMLGFA